LRLFAGAPMQRNRVHCFKQSKECLKQLQPEPSRQGVHCLVTYIWSSCLRAKISFLLPTGLNFSTLAIVPVPPGVSLYAIWQAARATPLS